MLGIPKEKCLQYHQVENKFFFLIVGSVIHIQSQIVFTLRFMVFYVWIWNRNLWSDQCTVFIWKPCLLWEMSSLQFMFFRVFIPQLRWIGPEVDGCPDFAYSSLAYGEQLTQEPFCGNRRESFFPWDGMCGGRHEDIESDLMTCESQVSATLRQLSISSLRLHCSFNYNPVSFLPSHSCL